MRGKDIIYTLENCQSVGRITNLDTNSKVVSFVGLFKLFHCFVFSFTKYTNKNNTKYINLFYFVKIFIKEIGRPEDRFHIVSHVLPNPPSYDDPCETTILSSDFSDSSWLMRNIIFLNPELKISWT